MSDSFAYLSPCAITRGTLACTHELIKNDLGKNMEWGTDLTLKNLARTGITSQTSLQDFLVSFSVPFICWPLSISLSIKMLALAEIFAILWMKSHLTVQPLKQYFYIGLLAFQLFAK